MERLGVINGLRGAAIVGTVFHHSFFEQFAYGTGKISTPWLVELMASSGWLGVNLFFFLSGFVLYLPYCAGKRRFVSRADVKEFYRRRFLRLAPLYTFVWIVSLVFATNIQLNETGFYKTALLYLTCAYPFYPGMFFPPGNWVMWSLGAEIWFSVLFPLAVVIIHRLGWGRGIALALLGALAVRIGGQLIYGVASTPLNMISDSVLGRLDEFVLGMFAAYLYKNGFKASPLHLIVGVGLFVIGAAVWQYRFLSTLPPVSGAFANDFVDAGILLITVALLTLQHRWIAAIEARWLQLLGVMCYSIYLWHGIIQVHFKHSMFSSAFAYMAYLGVVLALSAFTFRYIEFRNVASWRELIPVVESRSSKVTIERRT